MLRLIVAVVEAFQAIPLRHDSMAPRETALEFSGFIDTRIGEERCSPTSVFFCIPANIEEISDAPHGAISLAGACDPSVFRRLLGAESTFLVASTAPYRSFLFKRIMHDGRAPSKRNAKRLNSSMFLHLPILLSTSLSITTLVLHAILPSSPLSHQQCPTTTACTPQSSRICRARPSPSQWM